MIPRRNQMSNDLYVVVATAFGNKGEVISSPKFKEDAELLADKLKDGMEGIDKEFQTFTNIKVKKYEMEPFYLDNAEKNDYNYSVLDDLDKKIKK